MSKAQIVVLVTTVVKIVLVIIEAIIKIRQNQIIPGAQRRGLPNI